MNDLVLIAIGLAILVGPYVVPKIWKSTTSSIDSSITDIKAQLNDIREEQLRSRKILTWRNAGTAAFRGLAAYGAVELFNLLFEPRW